ncbi:oxygen tolerance protein BatD [Tahibacter aquaticus]|uniref:Oxygen tolerance protein BatD n=1 Tax=Tahibacter aquaticus TaxID=520092 RepID=A0A4R6YTN2_9GAMM|nr:BatD family protein [Tahibacter aquaticus]TDR41696.1 oxygen tolerance protein BatD [Tahibacter aquaticus]
MNTFPRWALRTLLALLLAALVWPALAADTVRAWLDRDSMQLGETVTLNVETSGALGEPDFSGLEADFELLNRSNSSSVSIVNGSASSTQLWAIGLKPRREGKLTVPALSVGTHKTAPVELNVGAAPVVASAKPGDDLFVELSADPLNAYVQQQVRVTLKLFYAINLTDGGLDELTAADAVVQKLGQDRSYEAERDGRRYRVLERRYSVTAQKSGNLALPAVNFRGRALSGNDPNAMFFGRGRAVSARSDALSIEVRPRPAESGNSPWLPAQSLELRIDGANPAAPARVGEPLTATITATAQGLGFEQLPELEMPAIEGAEIYPDKSTTRSRENNGWIIGERSRKFAIVPKRAGTLHVPAMQLNWWDTASNKAALAQTPAFDVEVGAATAADGAGTAAVLPNAAPTEAATPGLATAASGYDSSRAEIWRLLAIGSFVLWILTLLAFLYWRRSPVSLPVAAASPAAAPGSRKAFDQAVAGNDAAATARQLLAWARHEGASARNLGELAAQLQSPVQRDAIAALQASLYAADATTSVPAGFAASFSRGLELASRAAANDDAVLPPLWKS